MLFYNAHAPTQLYTLSLHDALPISRIRRDAQPQCLLQERVAHLVFARAAAHRLRSRAQSRRRMVVREPAPVPADRKSTRLNSSHLVISYAVFCSKKKKKKKNYTYQL